MSTAKKKGYHLFCSDCNQTYHSNTQEGQILQMQLHDGLGCDFYMPLGKDYCETTCG